MCLTEEGIALVTCFYAAEEGAGCALMKTRRRQSPSSRTLAAVLNGWMRMDPLNWPERGMIAGRPGSGLPGRKRGGVGAGEAAAA